MGTALIILGAMFAISGIVSSFIIIIDAFEVELWQGLLALLFWPYLLWYMFAEFDHEKKWQIVIMSLIGTSVGGLLVSYGMILNSTVRLG